MIIQNEDYAENWKTAPEILAVSAADRDRLKNVLADIKIRLSASDTREISGIAKNSRAEFLARHACRMLLIVESSENPLDIIRSALEDFETHPESCWSTKQVFYGEGDCPGNLGFVFPGQGSQYLFMGRDLARFFPEIGRVLADAEKIFEHAQTLTDYIFPPLSGRENEKVAFEEKLRSTDIAQPAIGSVSAAMMHILNRFGITPHSTCGHSYGELSALYAAARFDETTFFSLSAARGKYMADAGGNGDKGGMLAAKAPLDDIDGLIKKSGLDLILANRNSPDQGVLSGPTDAILQMKALCKENKIQATVLPVAAAFHSRLVASAAGPFEKDVQKAVFLSSDTPVYSNTTALPYPDAADDAKKILSAHLTHPVNFTLEIQNMYQDGIRTFVEVGPRAVLTGLIKSILNGQPAHALAIDASSGRRSGITDLAKALCTLASLGYSVDLEKWKKSLNL
jgi:acyl transferase domain-containing protein